LNIGEIVHYLVAHPKWSTAASVLDLVCGPGDLINHLAAFFPDKRFTGVDIKPNFVALAKIQTQRLQNGRFFRGDLYTFTDDRYDFIILKAVLQHLKEPDRFMKYLPNLLYANAVVLFIDTTRENFISAEPRIATFDRLYAQIEAIQKQHTGSCDCMDKLQARLGASGFRLLEAHTPSAPVSIATNRLKAVQFLILAGATVKKMMPSLALDLGELISDLVAWHDAPAPLMSIKSRRMLIERI
jgi:SAM-dependent methyltransferase